MSLSRMALLAACAVVPTALVPVLVLGHQSRNAGHGNWNGNAIRATLERTVPAHNDTFFVYLLENQTNSDYRVAGSEVRILGRSRSTGDLISKVSEHVSGEFPLLVPARQKVHFALVWTAEHDINPDHMKEFIGTLNIKSFVLFDKVRRYQMEFPVSR